MNSSKIPEAETDLVWTGPSVKGLIPVAGILMLISLVVLSPGSWLADWVGLEREWTTFILFWLVIILWVLAVSRWFYLGACYVYRLTNRAVHIDFGPFHLPIPAIPLEEITELESRPWPLWFIDVGTVVIVARGRPPMLLPGLNHPQRLIDQIVKARASGTQS